MRTFSLISGIRRFNSPYLFVPPLNSSIITSFHRLPIIPIPIRIASHLLFFNSINILLLDNAENITATGNANPANSPTQNISFSPAANATGATVKAIGLQVKDGVVTMDKLGSGTAIARQGLISKGGSVAAMTVGIKAV